PDEPGENDLQEEEHVPEITTAVPGETLRAYNEALLQWPAGFTPHPRLARLLERRHAALDSDGAIDWGLAETLAFAPILAGGARQVAPIPVAGLALAPRLRGTGTRALQCAAGAVPAAGRV